MSTFAIIGIGVGILVCIWLFIGAVLWLSRNLPEIIIIFGLTTIASFLLMVVRAVAAHLGHHTPSQPIWLIFAFTASLIMVTMLLMAITFDDEPSSYD